MLTKGSIRIADAAQPLFPGEELQVMINNDDDKAYQAVLEQKKTCDNRMTAEEMSTVCETLRDLLQAVWMRRRELGLSG